MHRAVRLNQHSALGQGDFWIAHADLFIQPKPHLPPPHLCHALLRIFKDRPLVIGMTTMTEAFLVSSDPTVMGWAASGVFKLTTSSRLELDATRFVERGGIQRLLHFLRSGAGSMPDRASMARLLSGCSTIPEFCAPIVEHGGFEIVTTLLREDAALAGGYADFLATVVRSLAFHCPSQLDPVTVSAIMQPLVELLQFGDLPSKVIAEDAISSLACCAIIPFDKSDEADQEHVSDPGQAIKWRALNERVIPQLAEILASDDMDSKRLAVEVLMKLAPIARSHLAIVNSGAVDSVLSLMRMGDESPTAKSAVHTLWALLSSHRTQSVVMNVLPWTEVLVRMLQLGGYAETLQVARTIQQVAAENNVEGAAGAVKELVSLGAIPSLVKLLQSKDTWRNVRTVQPELETKAKAEGALALQALVASDATAQSIAFRAGAIEALVEVLRGADAVGRRNAAKALACLAFGTAEIRTAIVHAGVVDMFIELHRAGVQEGDTETADSVANALLVLRDGLVQ
jgi:hypothetical protein